MLPGSGLNRIGGGTSLLGGAGDWKSEGFVIHSWSAFWSLRTCKGFEAIPTKAMISRNSSSPASQSCCTSSPPEKIRITKNPPTDQLITYPSRGVCRSTPADSPAARLGRAGAQLRSWDSTCSPLQRTRRTQKPVSFQLSRVPSRQTVSRFQTTPFSIVGIKKTLFLPSGRVKRNKKSAQKKLLLVNGEQKKNCCMHHDA